MWREGQALGWGSLVPEAPVSTQITFLSLHPSTAPARGLGAGVQRPGVGLRTRAREHAGAGPLGPRSVSVPRGFLGLQPHWSSRGWQAGRTGPGRPTAGTLGPVYCLYLPCLLLAAPGAVGFRFELP